MVYFYNLSNVEMSELIVSKQGVQQDVTIYFCFLLGREDLDIMEIRETPVENEEIYLETGCKISPDVFVEVIKGNFVGYFASVLEKVEDDYKIQYFKQRKSKQHGNY